MDEQMRLFENEIRGGGGSNFRPHFMPSSVRAHLPHRGGGHHRGGGSVPPPPSYPRPQYLNNQQQHPPPGLNHHMGGGGGPPRGLSALPPRPPNLIPKAFCAAPQIRKPGDAEDGDDDDILATLMKYEKEVKEEKGDKKKRKLEDQGSGSASKLMKPSSVTASNQSKPGTEVTPDEIKQKAKQMVEAVKASQVVEKTKKINQQNTKGGGKKQKKMIRMAGGQMWEDNSLANWDNNDFRIFCGDLGNDVTDEVLNRTFGKYPSFQQARVVRDKRTNKTKGYGFVSFKDPADFTKAIKEMDGKYVGSRPIKLRRSNWKDRNIDQVKHKQKSKASMGYKV